MKKYLALLLALVMVFALCACPPLVLTTLRLLLPAAS